MTTVVVRAPARPSPPAGPGRVHRTIRFTAPPLAAYLLGQLVYLAAAHDSGTDYFSVAAHERRDSFLYEQIAQHGYRMFACGADPKLAFHGNAWCGNAGWFPLYPWLARLVGVLTGLSLGASALLVAEVATLAAVLLFWWLLARPVSDAPSGTGLRDTALLAIVVAFPTGIYFHAVFPLSIAVAATLACLGLVVRERWVWAGLAGAVAAAAYPVGIAAGIAAVVVIAVRAWSARDGRYLGRALLVGTLSVCGILLVFAVLQVSTGHWNGYFLSQEKYGGQRGDPVSAFVSMVTLDYTRPDSITPLAVAVRWDMWWSLGLVVLACACAALAAVRRRLGPLDLGLAVYAVVAWLVPLFAGTQISQYRSHDLLLPAVLLLRHLPGWALVLLAVLSGMMAYRMGVLFFVSALN